MKPSSNTQKKLIRWAEWANQRKLQRSSLSLRQTKRDGSPVQLARLMVDVT